MARRPRVRDKRRYPDSPEAAERRRQKTIEKLDERYANDPEAEVCRICGVRRSLIGMTTHMRRLHQSYIFVCSCGEGFNNEKKFETHRRGCGVVARDGKARRERYAFVDEAAHLPYRDFVKEIMKPWPK